MGMSRDISSTVLCGNVSEHLSRTTFSEIYEPKWDSVSRNRANDIQAGQSEYPISYKNGHIKKKKKRAQDLRKANQSILRTQGPRETILFSRVTSFQGPSLLHQAESAWGWGRSTENKHRTKSGKEYFSQEGGQKESGHENGWVSLDSTYISVSNHTYLKPNVPLE